MPWPSSGCSRCSVWRRGRIPERLEITVLSDRDGDYGFLLESPEALDWSRLSVALSTASPAQPVPEWPIGPIKLIDANLVRFTRNPTPDYNLQWIELLIQQDIDLFDHVLDAAPTAKAESFTPFFVFPSGSIYRAGTVLRVHNGANPGDDPESREDVYLYANNGESRLAARTMILRLTKPDGAPLHARPFQRGPVWTESDVRVIPSGDGARAFILPLNPDGTPRPPENQTWRLDLTWWRDIGPQAPVLRRFGFTAPETAILQFSTGTRLPLSANQSA